MGKALIMRDGKGKWTDGYPYRETGEVTVEDADWSVKKLSTTSGGYYQYVSDYLVFKDYFPTTGRTYRVIFGGETFDCMVYFEGISYIFGGISAGFPFGLSQGVDALWTITWDTRFGESVTIQISHTEEAETVHTMDGDLLPSEEWEFELEDGSTVTKKVVVAE